jgi:hypothetical protein
MINRRITLVLVSAGLLLAWQGTSVRSQTDGAPHLFWHTLASGGQRSQSNPYRVDGSIGQSMAGPPPATGGERRVTSGFWTQPAPTATPPPTQPAPTATPSPESVHLPVIKR